jgi:hypothetical protein
LVMMAQAYTEGIVSARQVLPGIRGYRLVRE